MKAFLAFVAAAFFVTYVYAVTGTLPITVQVPNGALPGSILPAGNWTVAFDDEFTGTSYDTTKWPNTPAEGAIIDGQGCQTLSAIVVSGGILTITGQPTSRCTNSGYVSGGPWPNATCTGPCTGGQLISTRTYGPGYYEARMRMSGDSYSIFWVEGMTTDCVPVTSGWEGDIAESWGTGGYWTGVLYGGYGSCFTAVHSPTVSPAADNFHVIGMLWDATAGVTSYYDGVAQWTFPGPVGSALADIRVNSYHESQSFSPLQIDWVRYYQRS